MSTPVPNRTGGRSLDLYHRTSPENAQTILEQKKMTSKYSDKTAYFSTHKDSEYGKGFGEGVVHVQVPENIAQIEDEFPSGEQHYRVPVNLLRTEHFKSGAGEAAS